MLLILSTRYEEYTTEEVMDWLTLYNCSFVRLNGEALENEAVRVTLGENNKFSIGNVEFGEVEKIWNRRWWKPESLRVPHASLSPENSITLNKYLFNEYIFLSKYFFSMLKDKIWIDDKGVTDSFNKLTVLSIATEIDLKIPETLVTNEASQVIDFIKKHKRVITKPIHNVAGFNDTDGCYSLETREITTKDIKSFPQELFFISLFQELVEKKYELRIFYIDGKFYPMAIFSQRREEARIDYRMYDFKKPDRMVPYSLNENITTKLKELVNRINLKHCSIDCMVSKENEIYFLEVNPIGQFGMVSKPCNYYLEKEMAIFLKK